MNDQEKLARDVEVEALTNLLVKWVHQPEAAHRLEQVLGVMNGGRIFAQSDRICERHTDIVEQRFATDMVYGDPKLSPLWKEVCRSHLLPSASLSDRKRTLICFILVYNTLLDAVIALAPFKLPVYVVLEIVDWLPHMRKTSQFLKVRLIENVHATIERLHIQKTIGGNHAAQKVKETVQKSSWWRQYGKKFNDQWCLMKALIVLKGSYSGRVIHITEEAWKNQPSSDFYCPHLCGKTTIGQYYDGGFDQWLAKVDSMPFLQRRFKYTVMVTPKLDIDFNHPWQ